MRPRFKVVQVGPRGPTGSPDSELLGVPLRKFGGVSDGNANDAAALARAITALEGTEGERLLITGPTLMEPQLITKPINITFVHGKERSRLILRDGSDAPALTIRMNNGARNVGGWPIQINDLMIVPQTDKTGDPNAHGIAFIGAPTPSSQQTWLQLNNPCIKGMPGDAIHGEGATKAKVEILQPEIADNVGYGINANSVEDWTIKGGMIYQNTKSNILLSGTKNMRFLGQNLWNSDEYNLHVFNSSDIEFTSVFFDTTGQHGIFFDNRTEGQNIYLSQCTNQGAGNLGPDATYSDIFVTAAARGNIKISQGHFWNPAASINTSKPLDNIHFGGGSSGFVYVDDETDFDAGPIGSPRISNVPHFIRNSNRALRNFYTSPLGGDNITASDSNGSFLSFLRNHTIPAYTLITGSKIWIGLFVKVQDPSGTVTLQIKLRLSDNTNPPVTLALTDAIDPAVFGDKHLIDFEFECRGLPSAATTLVGRGEWKTDTNGSTAMKLAFLNPTPFNTAGNILIDAQAKWSGTDPSALCRMEMFDVSGVIH